MTSSDFLRECRRTWQSGARSEALGMLQGTLRNGAAPSDFEAAGRFLEKRWGDAGLVAPRVHLLGQCTTTWLKHSLMGVAFAQRLPLHATEAEFDSVIQELAALEGESTPDAVVLVPWHQRLLSPMPQRSAEARIA